MNLKVKIGQSTVTVTDRTYLGAGGEAAIYANGNEVLKLYHEPKKMIPLGKIQELGILRAANVIKPLTIVYDASTGVPLGYTMRYLKDTEPLCKLFTKAFKSDRNMDADMVVALVKAMQSTVAEVHADHCLIVDLNEMNVLVGASLVEPLFIDTDSYQTPSHHATAIMESIRDPKVKGHQWTPESDWYSFGILAFQLYINIHPFKGRHPNYDPKDWRRRMDEGASVFDPKVKLPPVCNPFSVVPKRHLDWFKAVFQKGERSAPPSPDGFAAQPVPVQIVLVQGSDKFEVIQCWSTTGNISAVASHMGVLYALTADKLWVGNPFVALPARTDLNQARPSKTLTCALEDGSPIFAVQTGLNRVSFRKGDNTEIDLANTTGFFARNNALYTAWNGRLTEHTFRRVGTEVLPRSKDVENVTALSAHVHDGVVIQDLLGRIYVTVPYALGRCCNLPCPALDGYRIVEAKGERTVVVVIGERKGVYTRFILSFKPDFSSFTVRSQPDISYDGINFTVLENGTCLLMTAPDKLEVSTGGNLQIREYDNPPLSSSMRLFNVSGSVFFTNGNTIHQIKMK